MSVTDVVARYLAMEDREQVTHAEIADRLGMTVDGFQQALVRARQRGLLPATSRRTPRQRRGYFDKERRHRELLEEWEHLRLSGVSIEEGARRLGTSTDFLTRLTRNLEAS